MRAIPIHARCPFVPSYLVTSRSSNSTPQPHFLKPYHDSVKDEGMTPLGAEARRAFSKALSLSVRISDCPPVFLMTMPPYACHSTSDPLRKEPRYPSGKTEGGTPVHGLRDDQIVCSRLTEAALTGQEESGRPENNWAPANHFSVFLFDFDMAMHDDHERTKVCVRSSIRRSWIRDCYTTIVQIRYRSAAWLM